MPGMPDESPIGWLLEESNPSVRYLTLTQLLGVSPRKGEAAEARSKTVAEVVSPHRGFVFSAVAI